LEDIIMKLFIMLLLLTSSLTFAGTDIEYENSVNGIEVLDSIHFKPVGDIRADQVCFNDLNDEFEYRTKSVVKEVCESYVVDRTDSANPKKIGVNCKDITVPAKTFYASRTYQKVNCLNYDRTDSTRVNCTDSELVELEYSLEYTSKRYESWDYRREHGATYETTPVRECDCV
jgi:hypothetical protein